MKEFQTFIASSIVTLKNERNNIGAFAYIINQKLRELYDIQLKIFECEFYPNHIEDEAKQKKYDAELCKSQCFVCMFKDEASTTGKRVGKFTINECKLAYSQQITMRVFIQNTKSDLIDEVNNSLENPDIPTEFYNSINDIKIFILTSCLQYFGLKNELKIDDEGTVFLSGKPYLNLND